MPSNKALWGAETVTRIKECIVRDAADKGRAPSGPDGYEVILQGVQDAYTHGDYATLRDYLAKHCPGDPHLDKYPG